MTAVALGLDFGTESVRALLVDAMGMERGQGVAAYQHGQMTERLASSGANLPPGYALQDPRDWIDGAAIAIACALAEAKIDGEKVVGIGVDFTSCTMLPTRRDGEPLCNLERFRRNPLAWPKLWKHHGALSQTARMNEIASARKEKFLARYGGIIGLEWFFPKLLETIEEAPEVANAAEVWLEAGDWFVWQLIGGPAEQLPRSTCQAGYKGLWSPHEGYPSLDFFAAVHPQLAEAAATKLPGRFLSPGERAGNLSPQMAKRFSLAAGTPVSAAIIDAHAAVPGVGVGEPGVLVMVLGTSSCHMLNATSDRFVPGVAGIVEGGILPGYFGYETGQAAVGDAFAWLMRLVGHDSLESLTRDAMHLSPGAEGVFCVDWMNGCRTPLMDGSLRGAFAGLSLHHEAHHLYRALLEASGFGLRWIVELLAEHGVGVHRLVATGGLPHHNRGIVEIYADVLGSPIEIHPSRYGPALGAAVLGMVAAGPEVSELPDLRRAAERMAGIPEDLREIVSPRQAHLKLYDDLYRRYRHLAQLVSQFQLGPSPLIHKQQIVSAEL